MQSRIFSIVMILVVASMVSACGNAGAKSFGGTTSIDLPAGKKLINITWKESNLWYLTRDMRPGETAETYSFSEKSNLGIVNGTVIVKEHAKKK